MNGIFVLILALSAAAAVYSSDSPAEISHALSFYAVIPSASNPYSAIPGLGYDFRIIKDAFIFLLSVNANAGIGRAIADGEDIYGIYKNEWRVPAVEIPGRTAVYIRGETAASFGWNVFSFFQKRQFIILTLSVLFEREDLGGRVFSKFGRYSSCISISSEAFDLFKNQCLVSVGYGSVSFSDIGEAGTLGNYVKAGLSMEFKQPPAPEVIYNRGSVQENNKNPAEGETVW
jgi:hypothetical protein